MIHQSDFLAQLGSLPPFSEGIEVMAGQAIGIDAELNLAVLAVADGEAAQSARLAVEILMDDMQANLGSVTQSEAVKESPGVICLRESLANIEEYFCDEGLAPVSLAAIQLDECGVSSLMLSGRIAAYLRQPGEHRLSPAMPIALAGDASEEPLFLELSPHDESCILLLPARVDQAIGTDFTRLSLGRFCGTPDMLFRQLAIRSQRNGMNDPPSLLFASLRPGQKTVKKGFIGRLFHR